LLWLTENAKQNVGSLHHALKSAEHNVPKKARVPFASLLTLLLQVIGAIDALLDALRSDDDEEPKPPPPPPPPSVPKADEEEETPDRDTPPRR